MIKKDSKLSKSSVLGALRVFVADIANERCKETSLCIRGVDRKNFCCI